MSKTGVFLEEKFRAKSKTVRKLEDRTIIKAV